MVAQEIQSHGDNPRLAALRALMRAADLDAYVVRATDGYLNEYVPIDESLRAALTGFTGSMGDAVITAHQAWLVVDGRYTLQAKREAQGFQVKTLPLGTAIDTGVCEMVESLCPDGKVGVEGDRTDVSQYKRLQRVLSADVVATPRSLMFDVLAREGQKPARAKGHAWPIDPALSGRSVRERLDLVKDARAHDEVDGYVVVALDVLAWLSNLRGDQFIHQATFRGRGVALADRVMLGFDQTRLKEGAAPVDEAIAWCAPDALAAEVSQSSNRTVTLGFDPARCPVAVRDAFVRAGCVLKACPDPFARLMTQKTPAELRHMVHAFATADACVLKLQRWVAREVKKGPVTEADVATKIERLYRRAGAFGLSFRVIAAQGPHGAIVHYGTPDQERPLEEGDLFLLDSGAYFAGGYATDLTRTFVVGGRHVTAKPRHKQLFTLVLKAAIAGMSARVPVGTTGAQLDAIVRAPLWRAGHQYLHGTGHGVGVNVHEFPPRVGPGVSAPVEVGQVFSIEPGLYLEGELGIRIENLCTAVPDPDDDRFIRIKPLTFSPLDKRLIDRRLLDAQERAFLTWFDRRHKHQDQLEAELPPLL